MKEEKKNLLQLAIKLGLSSDEYEKIKEILEREPNETEVAIYSAMWSEHASYKNSIFWIKKLIKVNKGIYKSGENENAGIISIGGGWALVFKIESHNHPSAVEPYQGAATGVGGINRDIFTTGARPIAQLNSLRFGDLRLQKTKWLMDGIVRGIADYGNCFGVPIIGGEVYFDEKYNDNPIVNVMSIGIIKKSEVIPAVAKGIGNLVYVIGSKTGKDGIHGASFASEDITEKTSEKISSVQVGDPFTEKLLLEAIIELNKYRLIEAMQDMGAAGLICSTSEMAARGNVGMNIYLDKVHLRQTDMQPWEILLSESQERMLMIINKKNKEKVEEILKKWDIEYSVVGEIIKEKSLNFYYNNELVAKVPPYSLLAGKGAPVYKRDYKNPDYLSHLKDFSLKKIKKKKHYIEEAQFLAQLPTIASKKFIYEQYDRLVRTNNITFNFFSDSSLCYIREIDKIIGATVDCNSRYVWANPYVGSQIAIAEAARNLVCSGAKPLALTNCLNYGNPYDKNVYWQFVQSIKGMQKACKYFKIPIVSGNVSFYNQTNIKNTTNPILPTPVIGMVGVVPKKKIMTLAFQKKGDMIYLIGPSKNDINQSQYLIHWHKIENSPAPYFNLSWEKKLQSVMLDLIDNDLISSAHDVSEGGLFITLLECCLPNLLGFDITTILEIRKDAFLFGESQGRVVVSVSPNKEADFIDFMVSKKVPFITLGHVTKGEFRIDDVSYGFVKDYEKIYMSSLEKLYEE